MTAVTLGGDVLARFDRFSLYNSPYPAHETGRAVDLYPDGNRAISPVAGRVSDTRTVACPDREYATDTDHLVLIDTGEHVARLLHVEPAVTAGETVAVGDRLGTLVRSGYFARWVDNHLHLEFREPGRDPYRATGSLPLTVGPTVTGVPWDGTGTVRETGETYVLLDRAIGDRSRTGLTALGADDGTPLDGGLVHYAGGGAYGCPAGERRSLTLLAEHVGVARGRDVDWADVAVLANGRRVTGLSLFVGAGSVGLKVVCPDHAFAVGDRLAVELSAARSPVRLG